MFYKNFFINFVLFSICISVFGCSPANSNQIIISPTSNPTAENSGIDEPSQITLTSESTKILSTTIPSPTQIPEQNKLNSYHIDVVFDYQHQIADVVQTILFRNNTELPINELLLSVDTLRTDNVFLLKESKMNGVPINVEIGKFWLKYALQSPLKYNQELELELTYQLILPQIPAPADDKKPVIFGYTPLQSNFVDWYPMIVPRTSDGQWILHDPWFYGEYLVYPLSDFEITITVINSPESYIIAASTQPSDTQINKLNYQFKNARNFVWSFSPSYQYSQSIIDGITVTSYYFPFHKIAGEHVLVETINAIKLYSELFGEFPRKNLSIVEADFLDGMEFDGFYFLSKGFYNLYDGTPKGYLTTIAVHETAHQWWYSLIANDQAIEPWIDEAMCTYSEYLYYEAIYPELIDWWWAYRVDFYTPEGKINLPIYDYHGFIAYRNSTYLRGAKFLHELRSQLGEEQFFAFLKDYVVLNQDKISTEIHFWESIEKYSSDSFEDLKAEFFN